jgi:ribonuclease PH
MKKRCDGRFAEELRPYSIKLHYNPWALGSVLISCGNTSVLCNVSSSEFIPDHCKGSSKGWISAEYSMLPHAGITRSPRENRTNIKGRTYEIQRMIGRCLRAGVNLALLGARTLQVDCDVIQADGGTRTASITGSWIALRIALNKLFPDGLPTGLLKQQWVAGISVGLYEGTLLMDLNYEEDSKAEIDMNVVGTENGLWIEIQGVSESNPQELELFNTLLKLAQSGVKQLTTLQAESFNPPK